MKILKKGLFIIFTFLLVGCSNSISGDDYATIQEKIMNMESYSSQGNVKYISNKGETSYDIKQSVKKDGKYIIETISPEAVAGNIILFDGSIVWQYNPKLDSKISVGDKDKLERKEISIFSFLENYVKSKDVALETSNIDDQIYTILEAKIPGNNKYFSTEKLWLNNETKVPEKLIIYDTDGNERVVLTFNKFEYNAELSDEIFNIENIAKTK